MNIPTYVTCENRDEYLHSGFNEYCHFWVTSQDKYCPNCGVTKPYKKRKKLLKSVYKRKRTWRKIFDNFGGLLWLPLFSGIYVGPIYLLLYFLIPGSPRSPETKAWMEGWADWWNHASWVIQAGLYLAGAVYFFACMGTSSMFLQWIVDKVLPEDPELNMTRTVMRSKSCLLKDKQIIQRRLGELEASERQMLSARELVEKEMLGEQRVKALARFENASSLLNEQRARYKIDLEKIELKVWENQKPPLRADWEQMTDAECKQRLDTLTTIAAKGEKMLANFEAQTELANTQGGQDYLMRLREDLLDCKELRQRLVGKLFVIATKEITGVVPEAEVRMLPSDTNARATLELYFSSEQAEVDEDGRLEFEIETVRQLKELEKDRLPPQ